MHNRPGTGIALWVLFFLAINLLPAVLHGQTALDKFNSVSPSSIPVNVSVTGMVKTPGSYYLTNMNRVTDAVYKANMIILTQNEPEKQKFVIPGKEKEVDAAQTKFIQSETSIFMFDQTASLRTVILRRNGKDLKLDLLQFLRKGDTSQNPYLADGDVIIIQPVRKQITVEGAVFQPGSYEVLENETVGDILALTQGLKPEADLTRGYIYRYQADGTSITTLPIDRNVLSNFKPGSGSVLENGDRIEIGARSDFHPDENVKVTGEVTYPGTYAIQDSVSLLDLLHRCGGPTDKADLGNAQAFNNVRVQATDPAYDFLKLQRFAVTNITDEDYLRMKIRQPVGLIAVSIGELWTSQDRKKDVYLHHGDVLNVPAISRTITILGQVEDPGVYNWYPTMTWEDYVSHAGGFGWHANKGKIRIIRGSSGNWIKPEKDTVLYAGDTIFVPSKADRTNWDIFKETLLITSQIVTTLFAIKSLTQ